MLKLFVVVIAGLLITSCRTASIGTQFEFRAPEAEIISDAGYLIVQTSKKVIREFSDDAGYMAFTGYSIYTPEGILATDVPLSYPAPSRIALKEGEYIVVAEMHSNVIQSFSIYIEAGKILGVDKSMVVNLFPDRSEISKAR